MIQITPHMKILLAVEPVDFRKGIDGLAMLCRTVLQFDPFSGCVFVFLNKGRTSIKILMYDGQGYWMCQKRLSQGKFRSWVDKKHGNHKALDAHELQMLLWNGSSNVAPMWKKIAV
jgi:transposase